ncbi:hypothetical protein DKX38_030188 [Salix brachista]|uniref:B30.2/SPRY domain-containing protein n=1 Tax=Salix brachista TaxID=2182728 RepID=A0A5N5IZJ4_9ROSI|nr:hypothetical protein DKX38_030188 [Salix brachista]
MSSTTTNTSPTTNSTAINSNSKNGSNQDPGSYFIDVARRYLSPIGAETELEPKELNTLISSGGFIVVSTDKLSIKYPGVDLHGHDVGVIQADKPVPEKRLYYFEIFVKNAGAKGQIAIGFTNQSFKMRRQPGYNRQKSLIGNVGSCALWEPNSYGYHGDDGNLYTGHGKGDAFGPTFTTNDTVGAGINYASQEFFFTKNGAVVGAVHKDKDMKGPLFPTVAVHSQNEEYVAHLLQLVAIFNYYSETVCLSIPVLDLNYADMVDYPVATMVFMGLQKISSLCKVIAQVLEGQVCFVWKAIKFNGQPSLSAWIWGPGRKRMAQLKSGWTLLLTSLILEIASAVFDQLGYALVGMVLAFVALLVATADLIHMAGTERMSLLPIFHRPSTANFVPGKPAGTIVEYFGLVGAVWQCVYSTVAYAYARQKKDNPIKMSLLPLIFFSCVVISKLKEKSFIDESA